jgi:sugar O-acyltransferase (sialic acid O-acetyltransferase NeuD family)
VKKVFGLFGCGGHGRESISLASNFDFNEIKFIDDNIGTPLVNGVEVISLTDFLNFNIQNKYFNISIADSKKRKEISEIFAKHDCEPFTLISPTAIINNHTKIATGSIISDYAYIAPNVEIGKFVHINRYSQVSHDCVIGNYVTFAPQVSCNGNVHICDHAYIGSGALIKQGTSKKPLIIGEGAVIGMGAVVTKDVSPFATVMGNPAVQKK